MSHSLPSIELDDHVHILLCSLLIAVSWFGYDFQYLHVLSYCGHVYATNDCDGSLLGLGVSWTHDCSFKPPLLPLDTWLQGPFFTDMRTWTCFQQPYVRSFPRPHLGMHLRTKQFRHSITTLQSISCCMWREINIFCIGIQIITMRLFPLRLKPRFP